jgi:hypothetical protein
MFGLFNKSRSKKILIVSLDDVEIASVSADELPVEKTPAAKLSHQNAVLKFTDSAGSAYSHALAFEEGWLHLSVRVHPNLACQADCLISDSEHTSEADFQSGKTKGIRFQPFYLSGCAGNPAELNGRGLFFRGLHFSGTITPGNVSLSCICDACHRSFRLQSFHAGFGNCGYFYSDSGVHTLIVDGNVNGCPPAMGKPEADALATLEARLPKSSKDGTSFRYTNSLRCPHCGAAYIDFQKFPKDRETEYYGNYLYGEKPDHFQEKPS